jgi:ribonuclease P protein component
LFAAFCLARKPAADSAKHALPAGPRLGVTATRALGGAVVRNRIKRRLREAFRLHRSNLAAPWDIVLNPRRAAAGASFAEVQNALMKVFARCEIQPGFNPGETNDRTKVSRARVMEPGVTEKR